MTDDTAPKPDTRFQPGRPKTGGRAKGTPSRHVSIAKVEQRVYRQINAALARHERSIDKIFEKDALEALRLDGALNRTTVQLLELLQQRRGSEGAAPASNNRMTPRQIEAAAQRAIESDTPVSETDAMTAYLLMVSGRDDDALQIELRRQELARAAAAPSVHGAQIPPATAPVEPALAQPDDAPLAQQSDPLQPPARVIDVPLPDGPAPDWARVTLVLATPVRR